MLISISIHAYTGTLCFRPIILKMLNSSELVVQTIAYLVKGRQMLQKYLANHRCDNPPLATCSVEIFDPDIKRMSLRGGHASV